MDIQPEVTTASSKQQYEYNEASSTLTVTDTTVDSKRLDEVFKSIPDSLKVKIKGISLNSLIYVDQLPKSISQFPNMGSLDISMSHVTDLDSLKGSKIKHLNAENCYYLNKLDGISGLPLESLNLGSDLGLKSIKEVLESLKTTLKSLNLSRLPKLTRLDSITCLSKLEHLNIKYTGIKDTEENKAALKAFKCMKELKWMKKPKS